MQTSIPSISGIFISSKIISGFLDIFFNAFFPFYPNQDSHFSIDDIFIECGICSKVCPVDNINIEEGRPRFLHNCEHCLACVHWCPKQAIQWKDVTKNRKRYHNPNVKLEDMISKKSKGI
ncbi:EFR1 family ferrodoxin [Clostridioides sp. ZZV15-6383]|uniref:EFR1 family ferrodoxin n=1 Tax=unclassified Clostridioides TaxID=2635829 RepID=UPI001D12799C|nr:EFR1 family ferrodoxin [Clostridioides sp. ZZV14-6345]MCC0699608.1 EFR1 family ferrodoxin [Clostridioides sp. ZZV15-6383]